MVTVKKFKHGDLERVDEKKAARGPFFIISNEDDLTNWLKTGFRKGAYSKQTITPAEEQVLLALAEYAPSTEDSPITIVELVEYLKRFKPHAQVSTLENQVRRISANLAKLTVFEREQKSLLGARRQSCYTLRSPEDVLTRLEKINLVENNNAKINGKDKKYLPRQRQKKMAEVRNNLLHRKDIIYPVIDFNNNESWSIQLITLLMERCSRDSHRDPRKVIEAKMLVDGEPVDVVAHTTTRKDMDMKNDIGIMTASDSQTVIGIITLITQYIERAQAESRPIINRIPLDVLDLCTLLGKHRRGASRDAVVKSLIRIIYTNYTIKVKDSEKLLSRLGLPKEAIGAETDFRLIKDHVIGVEGSDEETLEQTAYSRRWFTISLNDSVWNSILTGTNTRLVHSGLLLETNGYMQKLYAHIKLHTTKEKTITRSLNNLYSYFGYRGGITQFHQFLRNKLLEGTGYSDSDIIPKEGVIINFYDFKIKITNDFENRLFLTISVSEQEKGRLIREDKNIKNRIKNSQVLLNFN